MKFRFLEYRIHQVAFKYSEALTNYLYSLEDEDNSNTPTIDYNVIVPPAEEKEDNFFVLFNIKIDSKIFLNSDVNEDEGIFYVSIACRFKTSGLIPDGFGESKIAKIRAPEAGYPYVRAWVSNFFTSNGLDAVYLPIYNFNKSEKVP